MDEKNYTKETRWEKNMKDDLWFVCLLWQNLCRELIFISSYFIKDITVRSLGISFSKSLQNFDAGHIKAEK